MRPGGLRARVREAGTHRGTDFPSKAYWVNTRMGIHSSSRKGLVAAGVLAPVLALGYFAADPAYFHIATEAEAHVRESADASSSHARRPARDPQRMPTLPPDAGRLFAATQKGPRADRYQELAQTSAQPKAPVRFAALHDAAADVTASLPLEPDPRLSVNRMQKADREVQPASRSGAVGYRVENKPSASVFLTSLLSPFSYNFPGNSDTASGDLRPRGPAKLPRGLAYQGETEEEYQARQRRCLATAIYFEARGEPERGQLAVAQVVMNRVRSSLYPDTICGVVFQGQLRRNGCQFSFTCDGHADVPREKEQWLVANRLAKRVLDGEVWLPEIGHATHYHATYVKPAWRRQLDHVKRVGRHIFYRVRSEQIEDILRTEESPAKGLALRQSG